ncbi:MAG: hypothetical protein OSJ36_05425 [Odoribacter sp.]|nr:hypothetical protein [Odoribacter sp.]
MITQSNYPKQKSNKLIYPVVFFLMCLLSLNCFNGCTNDSISLIEQEANDDKTLLDSQLKYLKTRATNATNTILISTAKSINFKVENNTPVIVDWGDGNNDIDVFSHTYTDELPVHTIMFYGRQDAIQKLNCYKQEIIFLDITKNTALTNLECTYNRITKLNLSNNLKLDSLSCNFNSISELDVTQNTKLIYFKCDNNYLQTIDISPNISLKYFDCCYNQIDSIDVSNNKNLEFLYCSSNNLKTLDVLNNRKLIILQFLDNKISTINLTQHLILNELWCDNNWLTEISLPLSSSLQLLSCPNNNLNALKLPLQCSNLTLVYCQNNPFESDDNELKKIFKSLPTANIYDFATITISKNIDLTVVKQIADSKNWYISTSN